MRSEDLKEIWNPRRPLVRLLTLGSTAYEAFAFASVFKAEVWLRERGFTPPTLPATNWWNGKTSQQAEVDFFVEVR